MDAPERRSRPVIDELNRMLEVVRGACPEDSFISFSFDGQFRLHVDVRRREDVTLVEAILPTLDHGLFYGLSRADTPQHKFYHRVSAMIAS